MTLHRRLSDVGLPSLRGIDVDKTLRERQVPAENPHCDVNNDVKLFPTVYHRIYCHKFSTLSNLMSRYKNKCIRMSYLRRCDVI